jgi:drug/metabolite transporter (DMT)-like permease
MTPPTARKTRLGILLMIATTFIFSMQDGLSRHLAEATNPVMVVTIRYWFFALFVIALSASRPGGVRAVARTRQPVLQIFRGVLLVVEVVVTVWAFTLLGLVEAHAIFAAYPLMVAALSGPVLGERIGWRRWTAIGAGFVGVLVILRPGFQAVSLGTLVALVAALMFAVYGLLTRYAARQDSAATSFFYTGVAGAAAITLSVPWYWDPMQSAADWAMMGALCLSGALGHFLFIKAYDLAEAGDIQPFAYFQLFFASAVGVLVFGDTIDPVSAAGAAIILASGLYTLWRARIRARQGG